MFLALWEKDNLQSLSKPAGEMQCLKHKAVLWQSSMSPGA